MAMKQLQLQYGGMQHGHQAAHVRMAADGPDFTAICDRIAEQLHAAKITQGTIPRELYEATAGELMNAVFSGLGDRKTFAYEDPNNLLVAYLRQNIYAFSAAKSLKEMQVFNDLMIGDDGKIKPFTQFRNDVTKAGKVFNITHLKTDYDTALASTQIAQSFNEFADEDIIEVRSTGAENVCPVCGGLNGFTRPKSATIWATLCPPFHPNCNCKLIPGVERNIKKHTDPKQMLKDAGVKPYFQSNPAISKVVFEKDYPYMDGLRRKSLNWQNGYNMQSLDRIYIDRWPTAKTVDTKAAANKWWAEQAGTAKGSFYAKDCFGSVLSFDNGFRNHVFEQNNEFRYLYVQNTIDIIADPDEVWSNKGADGKLRTVYLKYYDDFPYSIMVDDLQAFTLTRHRLSKKGEINATAVNNLRSGTLLFRK